MLCHLAGLCQDISILSICFVLHNPNTGLQPLAEILTPILCYLGPEG